MKGVMLGHELVAHLLGLSDTCNYEYLNVGDII